MSNQGNGCGPRGYGTIDTGHGPVWLIGVVERWRDGEMVGFGPLGWANSSHHSSLAPLVPKVGTSLRHDVSVLDQKAPPGQHAPVIEIIVSHDFE